MLKIFFIIIILIIIFSHFFEKEKVNIIKINSRKQEIQEIQEIQEKQENIIKDPFDLSHMQQQRNDLLIAQKKNLLNETHDPWSKIDNNNYYIKLIPPSLNYLDNWKKIINVDFNQKSGEIIINSPNEISALVSINLMINNINNNISFKEIIDQNLLDLSFNKIKENPDLINNIKENISHKLILLKNIKIEKFTNNNIPNNNMPNNNMPDNNIPYNIMPNNNMPDNNMPNNNSINNQRLIDLTTLDNKVNPELDSTFDAFNQNSNYDTLNNDLEPFDGNDFSYI